jgi:integrase
MVLDPWKNKEKHESWKETKKLEGISKYNAELIIEFLDDMEKGYNVSRPGVRSYARLNGLRHRMRWMAFKMENIYKKDRIPDLTRKEISEFFNISMRKGKIKNRAGKSYTSVPDYVKVFKSFWHWYQRREYEKDIIIHDKTSYLDTSPVKDNEFVYLTVKDVKRLGDNAKHDYKTLIWFLFDSGIRSPKELMNVKVNDLSLDDNSDNFELNIREETSKTFGRKIKLLLSSQLLKEHIEAKQLKDEDFIFQIYPKAVSQYLRRLAVRVLGDKKTKGGGRIKNIRMYDFRHSSACYWLPRYKSESSLKYRFGWKMTNMIHHYTKLLGMKDTIEENDILLESEAKTRLEKEVDKLKKQTDLMQEKHNAEINAIKENLKNDLMKEIVDKMKNIK